MDIIAAIVAFVLGVIVSALGTIVFMKNKQARSEEDFNTRSQDFISENATLNTRVDHYKSMVDELEGENKTLNAELQKIRELNVRQQAENEAFQREVSKNKEDLLKMEEVLISKFENLSNKIFDEKSETFKKQSQDSLGAMLTPLKEKLNEFENKVNESFGNQAKEQFSLKEQIKNIVETSETMRLETQNLTNALKGDSKTQGDWGEVILEKILEDSGLRKGHDYSLQGGGMNLRDDSGVLQKPDVVVNLPENKHVIIDSKVSLTHYERFFSEQNEEARPVHLKQFLSSMRKHIGDLEQRRYQDTEKLGTPDFVLMFVPIEAAYILAVQEDADLQNFAWNKKVVLVCPTTLFATLRTVSSVWRLELQNKNAQEIAKQGGMLYDKIEGFVKDMQAMGKQLDTVGKTYDTAMNKLSTGKGNILGRTEKLRELGAKASKSLPQELLDVEISSGTEDEAELSDQKEAAA